jgi:hypothetical protein
MFSKNNANFFFKYKKIKKSKKNHAPTLTHVIEGPPAKIWGV